MSLRTPIVILTLAFLGACASTVGQDFSAGDDPSMAVVIYPRTHYGWGLLPVGNTDNTSQVLDWADSAWTKRIKLNPDIMQNPEFLAYRANAPPVLANNLDTDYSVDVIPPGDYALAAFYVFTGNAWITECFDETAVVVRIKPNVTNVIDHIESLYFRALHLSAGRTLPTEKFARFIASGLQDYKNLNSDVHIVEIVDVVDYGEATTQNLIKASCGSGAQITSIPDDGTRTQRLSEFMEERIKKR